MLQNMSLGSNGVDWVRSLRKFRCDFMAQTCALIAPVQPILHQVLCSDETLTNAPKHYEMHKNMSLGSNGQGAFVEKKLQCDLMAQTCALIAQV